MPSNHRPRKRHIPKRVDVFAHETAIAMRCTLLPVQRQQLLEPARAAFEAFRTGRGTMPAWADLADCMNVAEALAHAHIANDHLATFEAAQATLATVFARQAQRQSWTLYAHEITALDDALWLHGVQLDHATQGEFAAAIVRVRQRVQQALAGNAGASARLCVAGGLGQALQ